MASSPAPRSWVRKVLRGFSGFAPSSTVTRRRDYRPGLERLEARLAPATISWNVDADGFWDEESKWDLGRRPQSGDDVVIDRPGGTFTVTYRQSTSSIRSLTSEEGIAITGGLLVISTSGTINSTLSVSGGNLSGAATVDVTGLFTWTGGTLSGTGRLRANGGMAIDGTATKNLEERALEHSGVASWEGTGNLSAGEGSVWTITAGSTLDIRTSAHFFFSSSGDRPAVANRGTIQKTVSAGSSFFHPRLDNMGTGLVRVQTGTLGVLGGGTSSGRYTADGGATLEFGGGVHTLAAAARVDGAGTILVSGVDTQVAVAGTYDVAGTTNLTAGMLTLNGTTTLGNGTVSGGTLDGSALHTIQGNFTWSGGRILGNAITRFTSASRLTISGGGEKFAERRTFEHAGNAIWTGTGSVVLSEGAEFTNQAGAVFDVQDDASFLRFAGAGPSFNNAGTFRKTAGTGVTRFDIDVAFNNNGLVAIEVGTLTLSLGTDTGRYVVAEPATLNFTLQTHTLTETSEVTGLGTVRFTGGVTNFAGAYDIVNTVMVLGTANYSSDFTVMNVSQSGGLITGTANFTVTNDLTWFGGTLRGPGATTVATTATFNLFGGTLDGRNIEHYGVGFWTFNGVVATVNAPAVTVHGTATFEVQGDSSFTGNGSFTVDGFFNKSEGGGAMTFGAGTTFTNNSVVVVVTGRLAILGTFTNFADQTLTGGTYYLIGKLQFVGADVWTNDADVTLSGADSEIINQGGGNGLANFRTNNVRFALEEGRSLQVGLFDNAGELSIAEGSTFTATGLFTWTGGRMHGLGTLALNAGWDLNGAAELPLSGLGVNLGGTSTWTAGDLWAGDGARITVLSGATWIIPIDANAIHAGGDEVLIVNLGTVRKTAAGEGTTTIGAGIAFTNTGTLRVDAGTVALLGGLTNFDPADGTLTDGTFVLLGGLMVPGVAVVTNRANITLDGANAAFIDEAFASAFRTLAAHDADRILTLQNGASLTTAALTFTNSGTLTVNAGSTFSAVTFTQAGGTATLAGGTLSAFVVVEGGTFDAHGTINGSLELRGGRLNVAGAGDATGTLQVNGDFTQTGGILQIQVRDFEDSDVLSVSGTAFLGLGSTLEIRMIGAYLPTSGDGFLFLNAAATDGFFETLDSPQADFELAYDGMSVTLVAL